MQFLDTEKLSTGAGLSTGLESALELAWWKRVQVMEVDMIQDLMQLFAQLMLQYEASTQLFTAPDEKRAFLILK